MEELSRPRGDVPFGWILALWRLLARRRKACRAPPVAPPRHLPDWPGFLRW